nr:zinc finger, CCHC-type, retrotransposon Gag domain protein [Tanacetum cinerariifolium]
MVNTRTDADLSATVQNALQTLLPQIRAEFREEFRTSSGPSDSGGNPPPVIIHTWLERFNKQKPRSFEKATAPVDAKNWISHMEKIFDVMGCEDAFKTRLAVYKFEAAGTEEEEQAKSFLQKCGDRHQLTTQQSSHRNHGHNNNRHRSDRRGSSDNHRSSNNNYSGNNNRLNFKSIRSSSTHKHDPNITVSNSPGVPLRATLTRFALRVDADTQESVVELLTSGTITGTLFIYGHVVFVLFDTGATHSVISSVFASRVTTTPTLLDRVLCISTPMQDSVRITHVYRDLPLQFDDKIRAINALPLDMCEFDIILGMDWLTEHHATID